MAKKTLSERVAQVTTALPLVQPELQTALSEAATDPQESLSKSRLALEKIVKELATFESMQPRGMMIGNILSDKRIKHQVEPYFWAMMRFVNDVASAYGPHANAPTSNSGIPEPKMVLDVLNRLIESAEWYATEYRGRGLRDNFGIVIDPKDKLVLYVSSGGTDRCAMANIITRHYLEGRSDARQHNRPLRRETPGDLSGSV
jgi:hypothetical protein